MEEHSRVWLQCTQTDNVCLQRMCAEFQTGTPVTMVASPIHFLLTKLGGTSSANHWWSPGSQMLYEGCQDTSCAGRMQGPGWATAFLRLIGKLMTFSCVHWPLEFALLWIEAISRWVVFLFSICKSHSYFILCVCVCIFYLSHGL